MLRFDGTTGQFIDTFVPSGSGGLSGAGYIEFLPDNQPPVADAGIDLKHAEGTLVTLDATLSSDPDNDPLVYLWTQIAGPDVTLDDPTAAQPTFTAPLLVGPDHAILTFELVVFDDDGAMSEPDFLNVTIVNTNDPPVADAGADQTVGEGATDVVLDPGGSFDPDGDFLVYTWTQLTGPGVTLSHDPKSGRASFDAPEIEADSVLLEFRLTVSDGTLQAEDYTTVLVESLNQPPTADAGQDQTVDEATLVTLDATASADPDGDALTYHWSQTAGQTVALDLTDPAQSTFTAPELPFTETETLTFELVVDDGEIPSNVDEVSVLVRDATAPPVCDLTAARIVGKNGDLSKDNVLWPPNHKMHEVRIVGVSDPESRDVTIDILQVTQDEPLNGDDDGNTDEDAVVQLDGRLLLRAERAGNANGRVYTIHFRATNTDGAWCDAAVQVVVPLSRREEAIDDGQTVVSW